MTNFNMGEVLYTEAVRTSAATRAQNTRSKFLMAQAEHLFAVYKAAYTPQEFGVMSRSDVETELKEWAVGEGESIVEDLLTTVENVVRTHK